MSILLNGRHPEKNVWCNNATTFANSRNNATCGAQGKYHFTLFMYSCVYILFSQHFYFKCLLLALLCGCCLDIISPNANIFQNDECI